MSGHCVKCGKLLHNDTVTIEIPTTFKRQWSYHAECAPTNEPQHHIPPALLEALRAYVVHEADGHNDFTCGRLWNAVLAANRKDSK